jgi:hypothetical protein
VAVQKTTSEVRVAPPRAMPAPAPLQKTGKIPVVIILDD